jgi:medium-chain acyl-[acyl-carrier-protein] hydrolase
MRLFCFPHAGAGGSVYWMWPKDLPDWVEVCVVELPGRETRLTEKPFTRMSDLLDALIPAITAACDRPFSFFGHSMGAVVAHQVALRLERSDGPRVRHMFVSGRRAPAIADPEPHLHSLPDSAFLDEIIRRYGGIPQELLRDPDVIALLLPSLRADIELLETSAHEIRESLFGGAPLRCPITAFGGTADHRASREQLRAWEDVTTGAFRVRMFEGGHFYPASQRPALLREMEADLRSLHGVERSAR